MESFVSKPCGFLLKPISTARCGDPVRERAKEAGPEQDGSVAWLG
jgi:hypothetical protein